MSVLKKLATEEDHIYLAIAFFGLGFDGHLLDHGDLLSREPVGSLSQRMIWNQVLHKYVLLAAFVHWACTHTIRRAAQAPLEALIAARAEAARRHCCAHNQLMAKLAFKRRWQISCDWPGEVVVGLRGC